MFNLITPKNLNLLSKYIVNGRLHRKVGTCGEIHSNYWYLAACALLQACCVVTVWFQCFSIGDSSAKRVNLSVRLICMELGHILAYLTQSENNFSIQVLQIFLFSICGEIILWLTFLYETKGDAFLVAVDRILCRACYVKNRTKSGQGR